MRIVKTVVTVSLTFCILLLSGCVTANTGTELKPEMISKIQKGTSKRSDVEKLLGPPDSTMPVGGGQTVMLYSGMQSRTDMSGVIVSSIPIIGAMIPNKKTTTRRQQMLQITLDKSNVVQDVQQSDNTTQTETTTSMFGGHVEQKNIQPEK